MHPAFKRLKIYVAANKSSVGFYKRISFFFDQVNGRFWSWSSAPEYENNWLL